MTGIIGFRLIIRHKMQNQTIMKKILYTLSLLLVVNILGAQSIDESERTMSLGKQNAYSMDIENASAKLTEKVFKEYMKDYGKLKRNKKAKEWYTSKPVRIATISGSELSLYASIDERSNMTAFTLWVDNGGNFINSNEYPRESQAVENFMEDIHLAVTRRVIELELKDQEKMLKGLEKDQTKLEKKNASYHKSIENYRKKIEEAEANIEQNLKDQESKKIEIERQKEVLETVREKLNGVGKS